jgi:hypothetical protein
MQVVLHLFSCKYFSNLNYEYLDRHYLIKLNYVLLKMELNNFNNSQLHHVREEREKLGWKFLNKHHLTQYIVR